MFEYPYFPVAPDDLLVSAKRRIQVADHFLTQTYPMVQDPKLLVNILDGVLRAVEEVVDAILQHEREKDRIPAYHEGNFAAKLSVLRGDVAKRYNFGHIDLAMISEMQELLHHHRQSAMEFPRNGKYVMANDELEIQTLSVEKVKTYLVRAKALYQKANDNIHQ
jgi:hypothetical protein